MAAHYTAHAPAIHCEGCADSIRKSLGRLDGVQKVEIDVERKTVDVEYDSSVVSEPALADRLTQAGFSPELT